MNVPQSSAKCSCGHTSGEHLSSLGPCLQEQPDTRRDGVGRKCPCQHFSYRLHTLDDVTRRPVKIDAELTTAESGDSCALCEEPIDDGDTVVAVSTSLSPDECVVVCLRCVRAVGEAARRV